MHDDISNYKKLDDVSHVLLRSSMYIGSIDHKTTTEFILEDSKFKKREISYIPGLNLLVREIYNNSIDEANRTKFKYATEIQITMDKDHFEVHDNGRGIPIQKMEGSKDLIPVVLFTELKSGSNFDDSNRTGAGLNGLGSAITTIYSKKSIIDVWDTKKHLKITTTNNMSDIKSEVWPKTGKHGVSFVSYPDFSRFNVEGFTETDIGLVRSQIFMASFFYPEITFWFNNEKIEAKKPSEFVNMFSDDIEFIGNSNTLIAMSISEEGEFSQLSYCNNILMRKGGTQVDLISKEIVTSIQEKLLKKFPSIKTSDIKKHLFLITFFRSFPNLKTESQTKDSLSNSVTEIRNYISELNLETLTKKILKNENMMLHITENFRVAQEALENINAKKAQKSIAKKRIEKYYPATKNNKYLVLAEGDSAASGIMAVLGRENFGYMALRGKPINAYEASISNITKNEEAMNILSILDIKIGDTVEDIPFEMVIIASDQDQDGFLINGLLLAFFNRFAPKLVEQGRIARFNTPIMLSKGKDGKPLKWAYTIEEGKKILEGEANIVFNKGIGSHKASSLRHIIEKDGFENMLMPFKIDDNYKENMNNWLSSEKGYSDIRKDMIQKSRLDMDKI